MNKQCAKVKIWPPSFLCKLDGQKLKIWLGNRDNRIQHVRNVLKSQVPSLYPKNALRSVKPRPFSESSSWL